MNQDSQDELLSLRHRSPTFSKEETQNLVKLIAEHNNIINNKATNNATSKLKDMAWSEITQIFNAQGFKHYRSVDCLKGKWFNLKKVARKMSKNLLDGQSDFDDLTTQIVSLVYEAENGTNEITQKDLDDKIMEYPKESKEKPVRYCDDSVGDEENKTDCPNLKSEKYIQFKKRINRSLNFTPQECRLLLQCVRREKKIVLNKGNTANSVVLKRRAWNRITNMFNKNSPHKRSTIMLRNKLYNMKKLAKHDGYVPPENKKEEDDEDCTQPYSEVECQKIKSEPLYYEDDHVNGSDLGDQDDDMGSDDEQNGERSFDGVQQVNERVMIDNSSDPLSTILSGDSGIGSINMETFGSENSEVTKLKLQLLKYQLENAKLERKRLESLAEAEAALSEARATEAALRLRAARLAAAAAAHALAPAHPALRYTREEARAQHYLDSCDST